MHRDFFEEEGHGGNLTQCPLSRKRPTWGIFHGASTSTPISWDIIHETTGKMKLGWFCCSPKSCYPESHATYSTPCLTESAVAQPVPHRGGWRRISVAKSRHVRRRRIIWLDDLARLQGSHTEWLFRIKAGNCSLGKYQND